MCDDKNDIQVARQKFPHIYFILVYLLLSFV